MSEERKAVYYGKVELIPGIICDGYVLDDGTAVMSERGTADLLGMDHAPLKRMVLTWPPKVLKPFINSDFIMVPTLVKVVANNSPYQGRSIVVYTSIMIGTLISAYALALAYRALQKNQRHIGERCVILQSFLVNTALDAAIREACGLSPNVQKTAQQHYIDATKLIHEAGFVCSVKDHHIATKKDISQFLGIPLSTLNSFLRKHRDHIKPIPLDREVTRPLGFKSARVNGYSVEDVARIAFSMNTVPGIKLKEQLFGTIGVFAKPDTSAEVQWQAKLGETFEGLGFQHNYRLGPYRADFFIGSARVVLECNGYEHRYYNADREKEREKFITQDYGLIRFHHQACLEKVVNAILRVKPGEVIRLNERID
jgi:very-short-patch-repair endonuclease